MEKKLWLQLFADGGEAAGGDTGDTAPDAGEQELRALGVPEEKIRKRAQRKAANGVSVPIRRGGEPEEPDAGRDAAVGQEAPKRMSWEEIMADPEYNGRMQQLVQQRLKSSKGAQEMLTTLQPALELLAERYGLDAKQLDGKALAEAISDDDSLYEEKAQELGVSPEMARRIDRMERFEARQQVQQQETAREQAMREHLQEMARQEEELKRDIPSFDLRQELQNPAFVRLTAPGVGVSVADAYYAVHRKELQETLQRQAARDTAERMAASIQAGQSRPVENGIASQAATTGKFDYANMTKEQRQALREQIRQAAARGEKIYPV